MKEVIGGHVCEMIINGDGSFTFKFDGEETWHTRTAAKKMAEVDNTFDKIFKVYFKGVIERYTFSKRIERYKNVV